MFMYVYILYDIHIIYIYNIITFTIDTAPSLIADIGIPQWLKDINIVDAQTYNVMHRLFKEVKNIEFKYLVPATICDFLLTYIDLLTIKNNGDV